MLVEAELAVREAIGSAGSLRSALWEWEKALGNGFSAGRFTERTREHGLQTYSQLDEINAFQDLARKVDLCAQQVTIMFGKGHPVDTAYSECAEALGRILRAALLIPDLLKSGARASPRRGRGDRGGHARAA